MMPTGESNTIEEELNVKCFNSKIHEFSTDLDQLEENLTNNHRSCLLNNFEDIDTSLSMEELICKMDCPQMFENEQ